MVSNYLLDTLNLAGTLIATGTALIVSIYLVSKFTLSALAAWFAPPAAFFRRRAQAWQAWRERMRARSFRRARERDRKRMETAQTTRRTKKKEKTAIIPEPETEPVAAAGVAADTPPWQTHEEQPEDRGFAEIQEIPICQVEDLPPVPPPVRSR